MADNSLPFHSRIKSKDESNALFKNGLRLNAFPVRLIYHYTENHNQPGFKVMFSVPKRNFKKAVDRNQIKRQLKEAFRTHKDLLPIKEGKLLLLGVIYSETEIRDFNYLQKRLILSLQKLNKRANAE